MLFTIFWVDIPYCTPSISLIVIIALYANLPLENVWANVSALYDFKHYHVHGIFDCIFSQYCDHIILF